MEIKDKVAIVTGGGSGLGEATAKRLADLGAKVGILDVVEEGGKRVESEIGTDKAIFVKTDVTSEQDVKNAIDKTVEKFGAIHFAINCAGISDPCKVLGKGGPHPLDRFKRVIDINLVGTFNVIRLAVEKMANNEPNEEGERGVIVNTASGAAFEGQIGQASYSASKGGVVSLTLPIARELADLGIRIVTIAPGLFETPMLLGLGEKVLEALKKMPPFPKRLGRPSEYAALVQHIIENPMLNGATIRLDGALRLAAR